MINSVRADHARRELRHTVHMVLVDEHRLHAVEKIVIINSLLDTKMKDIRCCMYRYFQTPCHTSHRQDGHQERLCNAEEVILPRNSAHRTAHNDMEFGGLPDVLPETERSGKRRRDKWDMNDP